MNEQLENECGARTCLHAAVLGAFVNIITLYSSTVPYLSAMLQEKFMTKEVNDTMVHGRS